jgi:MFS family permease
MPGKTMPNSEPPPGPAIFWGIASFEMLAMFRRGLFYAYLSIYLRHVLGLSVTETTLFATFPMVVNIIFQTFVWGGFSDRHQLRRTLIVWGEFLAGFGTIAVWYAHRLSDEPQWAGYIIILGLTIIEIFWSMSNIGWSALISDVYREEARQSIQGRLASLGGLGRMGGVWIGGLLYDGLGREAAGWGFHSGALFFVAAAVMFLSIIPMLFVPEGGVHQEALRQDHAQEDLDAVSGRVFWWFMVSMVLINFGRNSTAVIKAQYLVLESGFAVSSTTLSYIVNTQSMAMVLTGFVAGWLGRRLGAGNSLLLGTIIAVAAAAIIAAVLDLKLIYLSNFLQGFSDVVIMSASYAFASILIPAGRRGRLFSIYNATFFLSWGLAGTLIAGPVTDLLIGAGAEEGFAYRMSFLAAALLTGAGLLALGILLWGVVPRAKIRAKAIL